MRLILCAALLFAAPLGLRSGAAARVPPSPVFYKTEDSDEWVRRTLHVQTHYARVLLVDASRHPPRSISVAALVLNARGRADVGAVRRYRVQAVFKTLQAAADASRGGDLVAVMPGTYAGFVVTERPAAGDHAYVHFKALGRPGAVTINRASRDPDWMILLQATHHVIIQGFNIAGHTGPGLEPVGPRAGIMLDGDFGHSGRETHHVVIVDNFSHNHRKWGLHSTDTHTVLIQNNLFALSALEHSAYVSDGSDNYVIRRNVFYGSRASGLQCNLDTVSSFHELLKHPLLKNYRPEEPTRAWALGLVGLATRLFGENNFPDGKGVNFIIEENVVNENGRGGAGSFNFAGLQDSLVQNNLIYGNFNHGIAQWDDANPYDESYVEPGPRSPDEVKGPADLPLWGCHTNLVRNNTVLMANEGRAAMQCRNGSWGTRMRNNIFINDVAASIEVFNTSIFRLDSRFNVINTLSYTGMNPALRATALALPEGPETVAGVTQARAAREFVRYGLEPWVVIEGDWWRLNPRRPDFRPRADSKLFARWGDAHELPPHDLEGRSRTGPSVGALAPAGRP
jgi:hypothetical protein